MLRVRNAEEIVKERNEWRQYIVVEIDLKGL